MQQVKLLYRQYVLPKQKYGSCLRDDFSYIYFSFILLGNPPWNNPAFSFFLCPGGEALAGILHLHPIAALFSPVWASALVSWWVNHWREGKEMEKLGFSIYCKKNRNPVFFCSTKHCGFLLLIVLFPFYCPLLCLEPTRLQHTSRKDPFLPCCLAAAFISD